MKFKKNILYFNELYKSMHGVRDSSLFVCGAWFGEKFADNSKYFYLYALKTGRKAVWVTKNEEVYKQLRDSNMPVAMFGTEESKDVCSRAKYIVVSTGKFDVEAQYIGGATVINLWHGIPLKKIAYDDHITSDSVSLHKRIWNYLSELPTPNTYYFSTSEAISNIYKSCFRTDERHVIQIGQARNDAFFDGSLKKKKYSAVDYDRLVVYMPTHRNEGKTPVDIYSLFDLQALNDYCKQKNILFLIKKHYYNRNDGAAVKGYSNIVDLTEEPCDTQEILFNADVLITDYSSCYIDYLLLERPILFYAYDYEEYLKQDREMYFKYEDVTPGPKVAVFKELIAELDEALSGNAKYRNELQRVKNLFYAKRNQGLVCPLLMDEVEKL